MCRVLYEEGLESCCALRIVPVLAPTALHVEDEQTAYLCSSSIAGHSCAIGCLQRQAAPCRFAAHGQTQFKNHEEQNVPNVSVVDTFLASHEPQSGDPLCILVKYICRRIAMGLGIHEQSVSELAPSELCHTITVLEDPCFRRCGLRMCWFK